MDYLVRILPATLIFILFFVYKTAIARKRAEKKPELNEPASKGVERTASDGHVVSAKDDISCARFGHEHKAAQNTEYPAQYIVHDEPIEGYINLNGKLLKRSEADEYMRRHG